MLFTKSNVLKRVADHGLGHLSSADALAWCKSTAEADAESIAGHAIKNTESGLSSTGDDEVEEQWHSDHETISCKERAIAEDIPTSSAFKKDKAEDRASSNTYTEEVTQGIKRPVDLNWLKGSYVSKRARWDGPSISTPTPIPDVHGRRRQQTQSRLMDIGRSQRHSILRPEYVPQENSQTSTARKYSQKSAHNIDQMPSASSQRRVSSMGSSFTPDAQRVAWDMRQSTKRLQKVGNADEFQDFSTLGHGPYSRQGPRRRKMNRFNTNLESEVSAMKSSCSPKRHNQTSAACRNSLDDILKLGFPDTTAKPYSDDGRAVFKRQGSVSSEEEISYVTEVAPSSRNLEEFQYRKKRTKFQHITAAGSVIHDAHTSSRVSITEECPQDHDTRADLKSTCAHELDELVFNPQAEDETSAPSTNQKSSSTDRGEFASNYDEKDISLLQTPYVPRVLNNPPLLPELATFASPFFQGGLGLESPEFGKIPPHPHQSSHSAAGSSQVLPSQPLPALPTATPKSSVNLHASHESPRAVRLCASSTQSYNTTPIISSNSIGSSKIHESHDRILEEDVVDISTEKPLISINLDARTPRMRGDLDASDSKTLSEEILVDAVLNQSALDQRLQIRPVSGLGPQVQSEETLLGDHSADEALSEDSRAEELAVEEVRHDQNLEEVRDAPTKAPFQNDIVKNETYREDSSDEDTDSEDMGSRPKPNFANEFQSNSGHSSDRPLDGGLLQLDHDNSPGEVAEKESTPQVGVSSDFSSERSIRGEVDDFQVMGPILSKNGSPKTPKIASQVIGPGEQSPWASVKIEPVSNGVFMECDDPGGDDAVSTSSYDNIILRLEEDDAPDWDAHDESSWQHIEHSDGEELTPLKDIIVPPSPTSRSHSPEDLPSTQLLFEAALKNPWDSNSKTDSLYKSRKRVSFDMLPSDKNREKERNLAESTPLPKRVPPSPPPQETMDLFDEDSSDDSTMIVSFGDHFSNAGRHRLIPERNSQLNSSPAVGAQAQAFITADGEVLEKPEDHKILPMESSRHLQPGKEVKDSSVWQDSVGEDIPFETSSFIGSEGLMDPFGTPTFDMEDVLGKAGDFLEDWSVDSEIKKAKELSLSKDTEANGAKRRKLFGIV